MVAGGMRGWRSGDEVGGDADECEDVSQNPIVHFLLFSII
jgi:hypothetical protein